MNCKRCGSLLNENDQFCKNCGASVNELNAQSTISNEQASLQVGQPIGTQTQQPMTDYNIRNTQSIMGGQAQANNYQQAGWTNGYNTQPSYNQPPHKNSGNAKFIILGVGIVVAIVTIVFVVFMLKGEKENSSLSGNDHSNPTNVNNSTFYKVNFKGFTFSIPDSLIYEERSGVLLIGNEEGTWMAQIELAQGSFAQLKANKSQLQQIMQQGGYTATAAKLKTLGGVEYITLEITHSGQQAIAALAKANSMYFIGVTAMNQDYEIDYSILEKIAPIIKSASYSNSTNNMEVNTNLNMSGLAELAK